MLFSPLGLWLAQQLDNWLVCSLRNLLFVAYKTYPQGNHATAGRGDVRSSAPACVRAGDDGRSSGPNRACASYPGGVADL
jgi:hypothetical protein